MRGHNNTVFGDKESSFSESVVILNIPYWGAGVKPWELGSGHKDFNFTPSFSDKKLEVFCVFSSFHIVQMQVGLSEPHKGGTGQGGEDQADRVRAHADRWGAMGATSSRDLTTAPHSGTQYMNSKQVDEGDCSYVDTVSPRNNFPGSI